MTQDDDVRGALRATLGWDFSFACSDPLAARCLVPHPNDATRLAEWLVRVLPPLPRSKIRNTPCVRKQDKVRQAENLETVLAKELRFVDDFERTPLRTSEASKQDDKSAQEMSHQDQQLSLLERLYTDIPVYTTDHQDRDAITRHLIETHATSRNLHLPTLRGVVYLSKKGKGYSAPTIIAVFAYISQSLHDVLTYNHVVLNGTNDQGLDPCLTGGCSAPLASQEALSDLKKRVVLSQLHYVLTFLHDRGFAYNGFAPRHLYLTDTLWLHLGALPNEFPDQQDVNEAPRCSIPRSIDAISSISSTERWCRGEMSNFEYLMALNAAAGRRMEDGVFHPFLPWVTNFVAGPHAGWRDLSKSKFRLNKGDAQLDRTFSSSTIPHHITESLSEITYYIYMARRTPMPLLRRVVRTDFQAREYPSTMTRMFEWTPDECIPEFYMDASVFQSLHGTEMDNLYVPEWTGYEKEDAAVTFVRLHRAMLESPHVSTQLHHWIDLNFGAALSGERAISEKNVPLVVHAADKSPGFVQLFTHPHPKWRGCVQECTYKKRTILDAPKPRPQGTTKEVNAMLSRATQVVTEAQNYDRLCGSSSIGSGNAGSSGSSRPCTTELEFAREHVSTTTAPTALKPLPTTSTPEATRSQVLMRNFKQRRRGYKPRTRSQANATLSEPPISPSGPEGRDIVSPTVPSSSGLTGLSASRLGNIFSSEASKAATNGPNASDMSSSPIPSTNGPIIGPKEYLSILTITTPQGVSCTTNGTGTSEAREPGLSLSRHARHSSLGGGGSPSTGSHLLRDLWQQLRPPDDEGTIGMPTGQNHGPGHTRSASGGHDLFLTFHGLSTDLPLAELDCTHESALKYDPLGPLDDLDLKLLQLGLPIVLSSAKSESKDDTEVPKRQEREIQAERGVDDERVDPVYALPEDFVRTRASNLTPFQRAQAADIFSMGCIIAELYLQKPVFSRRSLEEYLAAYTRECEERRTKETRQDNGWLTSIVANLQDTRRQQPSAWHDALSVRLKNMPLNVKQAVLAMLHPNVYDRLHRTSQVWDANSTGANTNPREATCCIPDDAFYPAPAALFPKDLDLVYTFLAHVHAVSDQKWDARLTIVRKRLPSLANISDTCFRVVLPELLQFFRPTSHTETICAERVVAAVLFLLPEMARHVGRPAARTEFLSDIVRVYECSDLSHSSFLRCCLGAPSVLLSLVRAFGPTVVLETFVPVILEWLVPPTATDESESSLPFPLPFAAESAALTAVTFGALSSSAMLGPALTVKYLLPMLLTQLGRVKSRWTHLADSQTLKCTDKKVSTSTTPAPLEDANVPSPDFHVTFLSKTKLYEAHHIADAALQTCRELGELALVQLLLPRLFEVLPRLISLAEKIGSVRIEGVPDELGREIYVLLRVLRHVIRTMNDPTSLHDVLSRGSRGNLMDLLDLVSPPFLHPRVATAVIAAATTSSPSVPVSSSRTTVSTTKKKVLRSLHFMKDADHQNLRAFTIVGLSRTIVAVCQKLGADVTVADSTVVTGINRFLKRCSDVYAELEVSNFQWDLASELVGEVCVPLRTLVGKELFTRHFSIVGSSSVLQLLLLPLNNSCTTGFHASRTGQKVDGQERGYELRNVSALDDRLAKTQRPRGAEERDQDDEEAEGEWKETEAGSKASSDEMNEWVTYPPDLVRFAYHAVRLHSIRATSFLRVPTTLLIGTGNQAAQWETSLKKEMMVLQDIRRQQKAVNAAVAVERAGSDAIWLRPRISQPFETRREDHETVSSAYEGNASGLGRSWALWGEIRQSIKAHSSAVRCVSVDSEEELLLTGNRHGSCRVWRLAGHPVQARATGPTGVCENYPILALGRAGRTEPVVRGLQMGAGESDGLAVAAAASGVMLWDLRTSQLRMQMPFAATTEPLVAMTTGAFGLEVAVASARRVVCLDVRTGPRVAAEWYADAVGILGMNSTGALLSAVSTFVEGTNYLVLGTTSGMVVLLDARTGRQVLKWHALDSNARIVRVVQISSSQLLVIGSDKEARVYRLMLRRQVHPQLRMTITGVPEGITAAQISVHSTSETSSLFIVSGARMYCTHLPTEPRAVVSVQTPVTKRMDMWQLMDSSNGGKTTKSRMMAHGIAVLPLRQLVLLGSEDGCLKCMV